ncbi:hypothetical protein CROQUDRAFT_104754 [Cronartium quercuum f. sp. fusiforme G11]|uniref:Macrofage activating glycoprotein n=1 Tax=Cronartium quercuum f. sp. fusiforme G11 TaxID=708437 RepID=A0A9P6TEQ1_9BASI|nr:hypothetical protein CROQUDRAFT_104754 [Cronartium quercuum f. sp. fusiforme G11]
MHSQLTMMFTCLNIVIMLFASVMSETPLISKKFPWPNLPYKADTGNGARGTQTGYNRCNTSTQTQDSQCQTSWLDSIEGFCLWGAPQPNSAVGDVEGEMVAYCTKKSYGARMIASGAITGIQATRTPSYIQVVGFIDQTTLNLKPNDSGGEEDPNGADDRGNPMGAIVYSTAFGKGVPTQVIHWTYFVGGGIFCFKACDPSLDNGAELCEHVYDRIGCAYNMPADYKTINGTFTSCKGDDQLPVGVYYDAQGNKKKWSQPPESAGDIDENQIPYKPQVPRVTDCQSLDAAKLWPELGPAKSGPPTTTNTTNTPSTTNTTTTNNTGAGGHTGSSTTPPENKSDGALIFSQTIVFSMIMASFFGICFVLSA